MKVVVTGGAGFIGSTFVDLLLEERPVWDVVTLDALTYAGHMENLDAAVENPRHQFVRGDICDGPLVREVLDGVDLIFNLAAESHVDRSILSDQAFVRTNVAGTATLLAAAVDAGVSRFVQVSTDEVYGELPWVDPDDEASATAPRFTEETPLSPRSPYSATKAAADHLALAYHTTHDLDVVVTRASNNYGPRQYPEKLIPLMVRNALAGDVLPVYGDGLHVRDWVHVRDHASGILAAAELGQSGAVYNFGGGAERTNINVVLEILRLVGRPGTLLRSVADRPGHDRRYGVDFSKARRELGWSPATPFSDGLAGTVAWYRNNQDWIEAVTTQ